jgi:hypothetical protein
VTGWGIATKAAAISQLTFVLQIRAAWNLKAACHRGVQVPGGRAHVAPVRREPQTLLTGRRRCPLWRCRAGRGPSDHTAQPADTLRDHEERGCDESPIPAKQASNEHIRCYIESLPAQRPLLTPAFVFQLSHWRTSCLLCAAVQQEHWESPKT